jgi:hypothetical protein
MNLVAPISLTPVDLATLPFSGELSSALSPVVFSAFLASAAVVRFLVVGSHGFPLFDRALKENTLAV